MTYNKPNALHTVTATTNTFDFMLLFFFAPEPNKS